MADPSQHLAQYLEANHTSAGSVTGGACLQGDCCGVYKPGDSCSYRWQVVKAFRENLHVSARTNHYTTPRTTRRVATSRYQTKASKGPGKTPEFVPADYPTSLPPPRPGDWDIAGPREDRDITFEGVKCFTIPRGKNFESVVHPWWNNAHHLIPKATLRNAIAALRNPTGWQGPGTVAEVVAGFLLKAGYNVNFHRNMIILPMDQEVGELIRLPRHLVLEDADAKAESCDRKTKMDHEAYGDLVRKSLKPILAEFQKLAERAGKACVTPEVEETRDKLEELSDRCYRALTTGVRSGEPISLLKSIPETP